MEAEQEKGVKAEGGGGGDVEERRSSGVYFVCCWVVVAEPGMKLMTGLRFFRQLDPNRMTKR